MTGVVNVKSPELAWLPAASRPVTRTWYPLFGTRFYNCIAWVATRLASKLLMP